jgi:DNA-directed RNA polymerase subunit K/omega
MAEEEIDIDGRKVTSRAMQDLSDGKVEFDRPDELQELVK